MTTLLDSAINSAAKRINSSAYATEKNLTAWANDLSQRYTEAKYLYPIIRKHLEGHAEEWEKLDGLCAWIVDACIKPFLIQAPRDMAHKSMALSFKITVSTSLIIFEDEDNTESIYNFEDALWQQKVPSKKALTLSLCYALKNYLKQYADFYRETLGIPASTQIACDCTYSNEATLYLEYFENRASHTDAIPLTEFQNDYDSLINSLMAEREKVTETAKALNPEARYQSELQRIAQEKERVANSDLARTVASKEKERSSHSSIKQNSLKQIQARRDSLLARYGNTNAIQDQIKKAKYAADSVSEVCEWIGFILAGLAFVFSIVMVFVEKESFGNTILIIFAGALFGGATILVFRLLGLLFGLIPKSPNLKRKRILKQYDSLDQQERKIRSELQTIYNTYDSSQEQSLLSSQKDALENEELEVKQKLDTLQRALKALNAAVQK